MPRVLTSLSIRRVHGDRTLSKLPVLLILIGSDLAMMEQLNTYRRPFYQRGTELVVSPLNPAEVAGVLDLPPADALDAPRGNQRGCRNAIDEDLTSGGVAEQSVRRVVALAVGCRVVPACRGGG
jgi:hypothetical protein